MLTRKFLVLTFIVMAADFIFGGVYVQVLLDRGFSAGFIGGTLSLVLFISSFVEIPSGDWGDRFGQRLLTCLGLLCWGVGLVVFGLSDAAIVTVVALLLWSVGQALYSGAPISLAINAIPAKDEQARGRLVKAANVTKWMGSVAGGLLVLLGALKFDVDDAIVVGGVGMLAAAIWVRLAWPESASIRSDAQTGMFARMRASWSRELNPLLLLFMLLSALLSFLLFAWQPLVVEIVGVHRGFLGLALVLLTAVAAVGAAATHFESKRLAQRNIDVWILLLITAMLLSMAARSPELAVLGVIGPEFTISAALTLVASRAHAIFGDSVRNLLWSVFGWSSTIAMSIADLLLGWLWNLHGLPASLPLGLLSLAVLFALGATIIRVFRRRESSIT